MQDNRQSYIKGQGKLELGFQLLEATGWTPAYLAEGSNQYDHVYKDGVILFKEGQYKQFNTDLFEHPKMANVGVTISLDKGRLTNEILNLSVYQMNFNHPEITIDYINSILANVEEESKELIVYKGIDFNSNNHREALYKKIDHDLKL